VAVQQDPTKLPGPRRVLLGGAALYLVVAFLPWYRIEGLGFVIEFNGWHDLGVVVGILAIDVVAWELLRLAGYAPVDGDRGDRFSAAGGIVLGTVGAIWVLLRASEGSLAFGWLLGALIIGAVLVAASTLFSTARGPEALVALVRPPATDDAEPPPASPKGRPRPRTPTAAELREPASGARPPEGGWPGSPYATRGPASPAAPVPAGGRTRSWTGTRGGAGVAGPAGPAGAPGTPGTPGVAGAGGGADAPAPPREPTDDRGAPAGPSRRPGAARREAPPWRSHPEDVAPSAGSWPKTIAERQRDAPPLWAGRDEGRRSRRPDQDG